MLPLILTLVFFSAFTFVLFVPSTVIVEKRPTLKGLTELRPSVKKKKRFSPLKFIAFFNKPLCAGPLGDNIRKNLALARDPRSPEEFLLLKEILTLGLLAGTYHMVEPDQRFFWLAMMIGCGIYLPEFLLKMKIQKIKNQIVRSLPDTIDLLSLCVNAGLDFLLALKWVIDKMPKTVLIEELNHVLQEVNIGKPRREALTDFANRYQIPDLSTFTRALVQADRMGTSVAEALNIIAEDMRIARYRRGEQIALKAPLKMLIPLLFCIFPVVGIVVAAPVLLQFMEGGALKGLTGG